MTMFLLSCQQVHRCKHQWIMRCGMGWAWGRGGVGFGRGRVRGGVCYSGWNGSERRRGLVRCDCVGSGCGDARSG